MTRNLFTCKLPIAGMAIAALAFVACDDTYDLNKDINTDVTIGGDKLTVPTSRVEPITLSKILDLEDDSEVHELSKADAAKYGLNEGDYAFIPKKSDPTSSDVEVNAVTIKTNGNLGQGEHKFDTPIVLKNAGAVEGVPVPLTSFYIDFNTNDITGELRSLEKVEINAEVHLVFNLTGANGCKLSYAPGFCIQMPEAFTPDIEKSKKLGTPATNFTGYKYEEATRSLVFTTEYVVGKDPDILLLLEELDMNHFSFTPGVAKGKHEYENGSLTGKLDFAVKGDVNVSAATPTTITPTLIFNAQAGDIQLTEVEGIVDPKIEINIDPIDVTGIPDCLNDDDTRLKIANPMVMLNINNPTPLNIDLGEIVMSSTKENKEVGRATTEEPIIIKPGENKLVISPEDPHLAGVQHKKCTGLSTIIERIPEKVYVNVDNVQVEQKTQKIALGKSYTKANNNPVETDYDIVAPLAMKNGSEIRYKEEITGIADDLDDFNFGGLEATLSYDNNIPLTMSVPASEVELLDKDGKKMTGVKVVVTGDIKANSKGSIKLAISRTDGLKGLDQLHLVFKATTPAEADGKVLNCAQTLTINAVTLSITGGVTVEI